MGHFPGFDNNLPFSCFCKSTCNFPRVRLVLSLVYASAGTCDSKFWRMIVEMKRRSGRLAPHTALAGLMVLGLVGAALGAVMPASSFNNGSAETANQEDRVSLTIGQTFIGNLSNANHKVGVGFWYIANSSDSSGVSDVPTRDYITELHQNAPNPFNPTTTISFALGKAGPVVLHLYDVQGRKVATLVNEEMNAGEHSLVFQPQGLASGVYLYQLKTAEGTETRRMMLLK